MASTASAVRTAPGRSRWAHSVPSSSSESGDRSSTSSLLGFPDRGDKGVRDGVRAVAPLGGVQVAVHFRQCFHEAGDFIRCGFGIPQRVFEVSGHSLRAGGRVGGPDKRVHTAASRLGERTRCVLGAASSGRPRGSRARQQPGSCGKRLPWGAVGQGAPQRPPPAVCG